MVREKNQADNYIKKRKAMFYGAKKRDVIRWRDGVVGREYEVYFIVQRVEGGNVYGQEIVVSPTHTHKRTIDDLIGKGAELASKWRSK